MADWDTAKIETTWTVTLRFKTARQETYEWQPGRNEMLNFQYLTKYWIHLHVKYCIIGKCRSIFQFEPGDLLSNPESTFHSAWGLVPQVWQTPVRFLLIRTWKQSDNINNTRCNLKLDSWFLCPLCLINPVVLGTCQSATWTFSTDVQHYICARDEIHQKGKASSVLWHASVKNF